MNWQFLLFYVYLLFLLFLRDDHMKLHGVAAVVPIAFGITSAIQVIDLITTFARKLLLKVDSREVKGQNSK